MKIWTLESPGVAGSCPLQERTRNVHGCKPEVLWWLPASKHVALQYSEGLLSLQWLKAFEKRLTISFPFGDLFPVIICVLLLLFPFKYLLHVKINTFFFLVLKLKNFLETNRVRNIEEDLLSPGVNLSQSHLKGSWTYFCAFS